MVVLALVPLACAGSTSFRGGQKEAERGNWDLAVARFTRALRASPQNIRYKISLENAKIQASRAHAKKAEKLAQAGTFEKAVEEYDIAVGYDPSNKAALDDRDLLRARIKKREDEQKRLADVANRRPTDSTLPVPVLSARSQDLITMSLSDTLEKVYLSLGQFAGVNVVLDPDLQRKTDRIQIKLSNVTFQEALDQIGLLHKKGYRVLDRNTVLIFDDQNQQQRQRWDDQVIRTFYLDNVDAKDLEATLRTALGQGARVTKNDATNAMTVIGTPDELALADRFLRSNDKPKGEVLVEVEILEISRTKLKEYGLQLSNYQAGAEFSPTGATGEVANGFANLRAHLLSSFNASDWVVSVPSQIFSKFLHDDSMVKIISAPKLRAFEGKTATLKVGTDVPIISSSTPQFGVQPGQGGQIGGFGYTNATYKTVGVDLKIDKVKVTTTNDVAMEFMAEFSILGEDKIFGTGANQINYPQFKTRKVENGLRLRSGETAVIGGLLQGREANSLKGALGVESIPLLNRILGGRRNEDEEIEILVSITPHVLRAPNIADEDVEPLYLGLRNNLKIPGVRPLFAPEEEPNGSEQGAPPPTAQTTATPPPAAQATPLQRLPRPSTPQPPQPGAVTPQDVRTPPVEPSEETEAALPPNSQVVPPPPPPQVTPPPPQSTGGVYAQRSAFDRSEVTMKVGGVERVSINLFSARQLREVAATLVADNPGLEFVEITHGPLMSMDGAAIVAERQLMGQRVQGRFTRAKDLAGGTGPVITVAFRATRPGNAVISVQSLAIGPAGAASPVPLTGLVRVTVTQ